MEGMVWLVWAGILGCLSTRDRGSALRKSARGSLIAAMLCCDPPAIALAAAASARRSTTVEDHIGP
jgi:hypothetical protein